MRSILMIVRTRVLPAEKLFLKKTVNHNDKHNSKKHGSGIRPPVQTH